MFVMYRTYRKRMIKYYDDSTITIYNTKSVQNYDDSGSDNGINALFVVLVCTFHGQ